MNPNQVSLLIPKSSKTFLNSGEGSLNDPELTYYLQLHNLNNY